MTRPRIRRGPLLLGGLLAGALLAGCSTHRVPPLPAATIARDAATFKEYSVYWAGPAVDGIPVTQTALPSNAYTLYATVGYTIFYGNCGSRGILHDGGCNLPVKITTTIYTAHSDASFGPQRWTHFHGVPAVVFDGGRSIELYTDKMNVDIVADTPARALAAVEALRPFNRKVSAAWPAFPQPYFTPNLAPLAAGATGPTGATGATSAVAPPSALQPTPASPGT